MRNPLIFVFAVSGLALTLIRLIDYTSEPVTEFEPEICEVVEPLTDWMIFKAAVRDTAASLRKDYGFNMSELQVYDGLMKVFFAESKFKGDAKNPISSAKGLIQFMRTTRKKLNIPHNVDQLSELEQLHYVSIYYRDRMQKHHIDGKKVDSFIDLYMVVFAPAYTTAPDWKVIYTSCVLRKAKPCKYFKGGLKYLCAYHANKGYDSNGDQKILKAEIRDYILNKHYKH